MYDEEEGGKEERERKMKVCLRRMVAMLGQAHKDNGKHKNSVDAFLVLVGYTIGLGNLWRFSNYLRDYGGK